MRLIKTIPTEGVPAYYLLIGMVGGAAVGWMAGYQTVEMLNVGRTAGFYMIAYMGLFVFAGHQIMAYLAGAPMEDN